ncbi:MAG: LLM class flavin-dependent oxidoreductase [Actinomycetota bacterium]
MVTEEDQAGHGHPGAALRNPVILAKTAGTVDHMSGGRLTLGLASGWYEREFQAVGIPSRSGARSSSAT